MCKNERDLGLHKKENHFSIVKPKAQPEPLLSVTKTQSPVSHGNVQKTPVASPVLLPAQIACPQCKISCNDKQILLGHVSAEQLAYKFMCDKLNCFKVYISKSGLFKHKKTHAMDETESCFVHGLSRNI